MAAAHAFAAYTLARGLRRTMEAAIAEMN
jgi:hypothetical protein